MEGRLYKDFETLYAARGDYHSKLQAMAPYLAGLSGNLLKYANIANDLELNDKLVKNYIEILDLMFIVRRIPAYQKTRRNVWQCGCLRSTTWIQGLPVICQVFAVKSNCIDLLLPSQIFLQLRAKLLSATLGKQVWIKRVSCCIKTFQP